MFGETFERFAHDEVSVLSGATHATFFGYLRLILKMSEKRLDCQGVMF